jgi:CO/xanthine dehydrogenase FAD-binding subunit
MIPAPFDYEVADSTAHALLAEHGEDAKLLAGGHSLLPMMKVRLAQPTMLIDIARVRELSGIGVEGDEVVLGATTRHAEVAESPLLAAEVPILAYAAAQVGDPQIRHRGTIGGSLAHADPSADLPMTLLALGGSVAITGPSGVRVVGIDDFFIGPFESGRSSRRYSPTSGGRHLTRPGLPRRLRLPRAPHARPDQARPRRPDRISQIPKPAQGTHACSAQSPNDFQAAKHAPLPEISS